MALSQHPDAAAQLPHHKTPSCHQQSATSPPLSLALSPLCPHPHSAQGLLQDLLQCLHCPSGPPIPSCPSHLHKDLIPALSYLTGGNGNGASWEYLGLGASSPSSLQQHRKMRNKPDGTTATFLGTPAPPVTSRLSPVLLLPSLGTIYPLPRHELSQQAQWDPAEARVCLSPQVTLHTGLPVPEFYASRSAMP